MKVSCGISILQNRKSGKGFTLVELLVVITIIAILAALVLAIGGLLQRNAALARAKSEIQSMESALAGYKADMGDYPHADNGLASSTGAPGENSFLIDALMPSGSNSLNPWNKVYMPFSKTMLTTNTNGALIVTDPFGEPYGYSYTNGGSNWGGFEERGGKFRPVVARCDGEHLPVGDQLVGCDGQFFAS